jgi:hypothetical protein
MKETIRMLENMKSYIERHGGDRQIVENLGKAIQYIETAVPAEYIENWCTEHYKVPFCALTEDWRKEHE